MAKKSSWISSTGRMLGVKYPNQFIDYFTEMMADCLLIVLSADLIYLYFAGGWYDPRVAIEIAEVILLCFISLFGVWRLFRHNKELSGVYHHVSLSSNKRAKSKKL